jgi:uncharacterized membrane protein YcaP (DUF421 family)
MNWTWIETTWSAIGMSLLSTAGIYLAVIAYTRVAGLRSFSKMSSFDFTMTVAVGSLVASTVLSDDPPLLLAAAALAAVYGLQLLVARLRIRSETVRTLVDNQPVLLMENGRMLEANMRVSEITRSDLLAKLREANVLRLSQARAVILETTGDISVLHAAEDDPVELEGVLLEGVRRVP